MFKSFFKTALRYLWRNKTYTLLNFVCLSFGLTAAIITVIFIMNVFSYDKFHKNYNRLYSVEAWVTFFNGDRFPKEYLSASLPDVLREQSPEIEDITRIAEREYSFLNGDITFTEKGIYADENFFSVFSFPLIQASKTNALSGMNAIVISERMAKKFFNGKDCIGESLVVKDEVRQEAYTITAVFKDVPPQSTLQFDFVIPFSGFLAGNKWAAEQGATANQTWALLKENIDYNYVDNKIKNAIKNQETTLNQELFLFPLKEQVLYSYAGGKRVWNEMQNIVIIGTIGFSILLIACFNFINLTIALNFRRYREAGIKKATGASRSNILFQYLGETFILTLISLATAIILVSLLLPLINHAFHLGIYIRLLDFKMILFFISITLFTGLISGLLPALYLASANPIDALKGEIRISHSYSSLRQGLIIFQFSIPVVLIVCMMIIKSQDLFMRSFDVGVDKDKVIVLNNTVNTQSHSESLKNELLAIPGIEAVSFTNCIPTRGAKVSDDVSWEGKAATEKLHFWCVNADYDYNKAVGVNTIEGRFFNPSFSTDSTAYLINDIAARVMKNKNPVGSAITLDGRKGTIIGVFKDFHAIDLAGPYVPTIIRINRNENPTLLVKYSSGSYSEIINKIKSVYTNYEPEAIFRATLFRDLVPFSNLSLPSNLVAVAFTISLMLACMGLFGLASFTAGNRTKEIGIRKASGATTLSVVGLLLRNYTKWLTIAILIALPISLLLGKFFLGRFNFHTAMPVWAFLAGPAIAVTVAILTVSSQTWKAARRNPVKALRYE